MKKILDDGGWIWSSLSGERRVPQNGCRTAFLVRLTERKGQTEGTGSSVDLFICSFRIHPLRSDWYDETRTRLEKGLYPDRAPGGDRDHRDPHRTLGAGGAEST